METQLGKDIREALNRAGAEAPSDTPDYILAAFLLDCLAAFDRTILARGRWWARPSQVRET